jgi:hypothetical protein
MDSMNLTPVAAHTQQTTLIRMIEHPRNQLAWRGHGSLVGDNVLAEQYYLSACLHYHARLAGVGIRQR